MSEEQEENNAMDVEESAETAEEPKPSKVKKKKVYLPERGLKEGEVLEYDPSAYIMMHQAQTEWPCMSFDIIPDDLGVNREDYPHTVFLVAGSQAVRRQDNKVFVFKLWNLCKTYRSEDEESSSDSSSSDDDDEDEGVVSHKWPITSCSSIFHYGCVNRLRSKVYNNTVMAAVWSETKVVSIFDLKHHIKNVDNYSKSNVIGTKKRKHSTNQEKQKPLFQFSGHTIEGYAMDWSPTRPGVLATGDNLSNIHIWSPKESTWHVDLRPLTSHLDSVEDIQWSPNENSVFASCSADTSIKIWDIRAPTTESCMLTVQAHQNDVNVINWNKIETSLIVSGGDDGVVNVWDLRHFKDNSAVAVFKQHTSSVTSVEWHPTDSSVFASSQDSWIGLWDLAVERDNENDLNEVKDVPPQLLFMHLGQEEIKEIHWHPQIPGVLLSTAQSGFNAFRTISV